LSQRAVFLMVPVFAVLTGIAVLSIPSHAIDFDRARGLDRKPDADRPGGPVGYGVLFESRPLVIFGLASCCSIFPMHRCFHWWGRSSRPYTRERRRQ
jgi:hypothetical protein